MNIYSSADLLRLALDKAGEPSDGNSPYHLRALEFLNDVYLDVLSGSSIFLPDLQDPFPWARARVPLELTLVAPYTDGSVAITKGSTSGTFSSAPAASLGSFKDRLIKVDGNQDYYRVATHTAGATAFTLTHAYAGETVSAGGFKAIKTIYNLTTAPGQILRLCGPFRTQRAGAYEGDPFIASTSLDAMDQEWPLSRLASGVPERFCLMYENEADGEFLIRFSHYVLEDMKIEVPYIPVPSPLIDSQSSIPNIPREKRVGLAFGAAFYILDLKEDPNKATYFELTQRTFSGLQTQQRRETAQTSTHNRGRLIPRRDRQRRFKLRG